MSQQQKNDFLISWFEKMNDGDQDRLVIAAQALATKTPRERPPILRLVVAGRKQ